MRSPAGPQPLSGMAAVQKHFAQKAGERQNRYILNVPVFAIPSLPLPSDFYQEYNTAPMAVVGLKLEIA